MTSLRKTALAGAAVTVAASAAALAYAVRQITAPAKGNPDEFLYQPRKLDQYVTVCLGASHIHGRVGVDLVDLLRRRLPEPDYAFVNAGVNGDLAWNALQRLPSVIACDPDAVVVLVGTNDVLASLSERVTTTAIKGKRLPTVPTKEWYGECLSRIVADLQQSTHARVGLCSLPVLGENLASEAGRRVEEYNGVIRDVALAYAVSYLPVYERQAAYLATLERTEGAPYVDNPRLLMGAALEHYLLGRSFDEVSARHGLALSTDQIHLNSAGAGFVADEVESFLLTIP